MTNRMLYVGTPIGWVTFDDNAVIASDAASTKIEDQVLHVIRHGEVVGTFKPNGWFTFIYIDEDVRAGERPKSLPRIVQ